MDEERPFTFDMTPQARFRVREAPVKSTLAAGAIAGS